MAGNENSGRRKLFETPEDVDRKVNEYVADCAAKVVPLTVSGLCLFLGFTHRSSLDEYRNYEGFGDAVNRAKLLVENSYELQLRSDKNPTGAIFGLKNFGWSDKIGIIGGDPGDPPVRTEVAWRVVKPAGDGS